MKKFVFIVISSFLFFTCLFNDSLKEYYEQTYHKNIYLESDILKSFNELKNYLEYDIFKVKVKEQTITIVESNIKNTYNKCFYSDFFYFNDLYKDDDSDLISEKKVLYKKDGLMLLGDSLMQGVGAAICIQAKKENITCENLAKQSTGLLRKKYYNYSKVLEEALKETKIKNVIMLVGVNDLWDANENKKILKFGDLEWKKFYSNRISELVEVARKYNANLFWYELPVVKNNEQNEKVKVLNELFFKLAEENEYHFIKINPILTKHFDFYIKIEGKSKRIRSKDGVHFTSLGYSLVSQEFFNTVEFK